MSTVRFDPKISEKPTPPGNALPPAPALPPERYYFVIGAGVGICAGVITAVVAWDWSFMGAFQALVRAVGVGGFGGALTGLLLALVATVKDWYYQLAEWNRARKWADEDRQRAIAGEMVKTIELSTGFRLDYLGMVILFIGWMGSGDYTRETLSAAEDKLDGVYKICTPTEWNDVMGAMTAVGLRSGQKLKKEEYTFEQAVSLWRANVKPETNGLRIHGTLIGKSSVQAKGKRGKK